MLATFTTLTLLVPAAPVSPGTELLDPPVPVLVAKGPGYFVHAIPGTRPTPGWILGLGTSFASGLGVYLTDAASGEMRQVVAGGTTATIIPMGIDRIAYTKNRVVGVTADGERLYVLLAAWRKGAIRGPGPIPDPGEFAGPPTYSLLVTSLPDGKTSQAHDLKEGDFPKEPPAGDNAKAGPLTRTADGVACFGVTFAFKGQELVEQRYEKK